MYPSSTHKHDKKTHRPKVYINLERSKYNTHYDHNLKNDLRINVFQVFNELMRPLNIFEFHITEIIQYQFEI